MVLPTIQDLFIGSSWVLLVYDYFCTLYIEADFAWRSRWCFGLFLFYVNRYIPIIDTSIIFRLRIGENFTFDRCRSMYMARLFLLILSSHAAHTIIYLQTCALWNKNKVVVIGLFILLVAKIVVSLVLAAYQLLEVEYIIEPGVPGCLVNPTQPLAPFIYLVVFVSEAITVTLTLVKAYQHYRYKTIRSKWVVDLYRRGVLYSTTVLFSALCNTIIPHIPSLKQVPLGLLGPLQHALESALCSRLMFIILRGKLEESDADMFTTTVGGTVTTRTWRVLTTAWTTLYRGDENQFTRH